MKLSCDRPVSGAVVQPKSPKSRMRQNVRPPNVSFRFIGYKEHNHTHSASWGCYHLLRVRRCIAVDTRPRAPHPPVPIVKILVLSSLYPPHHAGTYDFRFQTLVESLSTRGHQLHVLTSLHGIGNEQRGGEVERRLELNGAFDHPLVSTYGELKTLEETNHRAVRETIAAFQPDLVYVHTLEGL